MVQALVRARRRPFAVALVAAAMVVGVGAGPKPAVADHTGVTAADGLAFGYYTDVSLFGGPFSRLGYGQPPEASEASASPSVTCPAGGGTASATDPDGAKAQYGPAVIFGGIWPDDVASAPPSGPITTSIDCALGAGGYVTASTSITLMPPGSAHPGGVGPGPFVADGVSSTCTASADGTLTGSTTITNGILETKYDPATQEAIETESVPTEPVANYTREGTIDHVGDSYLAVFNEQVENADGSITVNAVHLYLLGPFAEGEVVIGSVTCGPLVVGALDHSDTDGDGVEDDVDNCPDDPNTDQADTDGDGIGDVCEPPPADADGDGVEDDVDNCPDDPNTDQADTDGDGIGDVCEPPAADLSVSVVDSADPVDARGELTYTVTVANAGPDAATGVTLAAAVDGARVLSVASSDGTCTVLKGKVKGVGCDLGGVASGSSATVTVVVKAPGKEGPVALSATVTSTSEDPDPSDDDATETTEVVRP